MINLTNGVVHTRIFMYRIPTLVAATAVEKIIVGLLINISRAFSCSARARVKGKVENAYNIRASRKTWHLRCACNYRWRVYPPHRYITRTYTHDTSTRTHLTEDVWTNSSHESMLSWVSLPRQRPKTIAAEEDTRLISRCLLTWKQNVREKKNVYKCERDAKRFGFTVACRLKRLMRPAEKRDRGVGSARSEDAHESHLIRSFNELTYTLTVDKKSF
jgi:hypothetical protein